MFFIFGVASKLAYIIENCLQGTAQSWSIGGFVKKLLPRGKNEMILPDDSNPSIVWDPVKNKWVNTDGDEEEEEQNRAPPPRDSDLLGKWTCEWPVQYCNHNLKVHF